MSQLGWVPNFMWNGTFYFLGHFGSFWLIMGHFC